MAGHLIVLIDDLEPKSPQEFVFFDAGVHRFFHGYRLQHPDAGCGGGTGNDRPAHRVAMRDRHPRMRHDQPETEACTVAQLIQQRRPIREGLTGFELWNHADRRSPRTGEVSMRPGPAWVADGYRVDRAVREISTEIQHVMPGGSHPTDERENRSAAEGLPLSCLKQP